MASSAFLINGGSSPQTTTAGATVTLALSSVTGVGTVQWSIVGGSDSTQTVPTITPAGSPSGATATFTMTTPSGNVGVSWVVKCQINGGVDSAGQAVAAYTSTGIVGVLHSSGIIPFAYGEALERNTTYGIADDMNSALAGAGAKLYNVYYVDQGTAVASGNDGSQSRPYATIASGIAAAAAADLPDSLVLIAPSSSTESPITIPLVTANILIAGMSPRVIEASCSIGLGGGVAANAATTSKLGFVNLDIGGAVTSTLGTVEMVDCEAAAVTCVQFFADRTLLGGLVTIATGGGLTITDCNVSIGGAFISSTPTLLHIRGCSFSGVAPVITFAGSAGVVEMDQESRDSFFAADGSIVNGVISTTGIGLVGRTTITYATSAGNVDATAFTVPASPTGNGRFLLEQVLIRTHTALVGTGNVNLRAGTTAGGNELVIDGNVTSATAVGVITGGLATASLGASLAVANNYKTTLAAGDTVRIRGTTTGTLSAGKATIYVYGSFIP